MTTPADNTDLERRIDAALLRMPQWQTPADFAARLAAAAARDASDRRIRVRLARQGDALLRLTAVTVALLAGLLISAVLTWAVPWSAIGETPGTLAVLCSTLGAGVGLALTIRTLAR